MKTMQAICTSGLLALVGAMGMVGVAGVAGCESWSTASDSSLGQVGLALEPSRTEIMVGDTVTITARSRDTYGRDADLEWETTAGDLSTDEDGRIARVKFDEPGTYIVSAVLSVDGREAVRDTVEIKVKPIT